MSNTSQNNNIETNKRSLQKEKKKKTKPNNPRVLDNKPVSPIQRYRPN